ncbi:alpha/beta hydrolase [Desmospora activa]|uniref:Carboxylesterase n=1 Tax=Desmospora activa DSM 45169 TaxID=1121389 RepID=A0A2T4Z3Z2_9BACL|nr:alpha/beta fold hydrolase [Desmospora activa]PTM56610.1 carboxylesterase [Desmospora activa DSM 45169]
MKIQRRSPEPFFYPGSTTGILLIHGFTGTPSELRPLGEALRQQGYTVHAPLLPGHGTTPEELANTTWPDWWNAVRDAYQRLRAEGCERVVAVGLSMGGILALNLAREEKLDGVTSLSAPIWLQDKRASFAGTVRWVMPYHKRGGEKPPHIEQHIVPYDRTPLKSIANLIQLIRYMRKRLHEVKVPALIVQGKQDETVIPRSASFIYETIASADKEIHWYEKSSHIITLDKERERLFQDIHNFVSRVIATGKRGVSKEGKEFTCD